MRTTFQMNAGVLAAYSDYQVAEVEMGRKATILNNLLHDQAVLESPFKEGDLVQYKQEIGRFYSKNKRVEIRKYRILEIIAKYDSWSHNQRAYMIYRVVRIRKDGTEGEKSNLYSWDMEKLEKAE